MHSKIWFAYAVQFGHAVSATLPTASRGEDDLIASSSKFLIPGDVSAITTNTSHSNDIPDVNLFSLNNASQQPSNTSASLYNLPFGYSLPAVANSVPQCNGAEYGTNLDRHSCFDAWRYIGLTAQRVSWGPRGPSHSFQYRLPDRWSSGQWTTRFNARLSRILLTIYL